MEVDLTETDRVLVQFAKSLEDFKIRALRDPSTDILSVAADYRSLAGQAALTLVEKSSVHDKEQFENWELEAKLWHLVDLLFRYRVADINVDEVVPHAYSSNAVFKKKFLLENRPLYEIWIIIAWIRANMVSPERPEGMPSSQWSNTVMSGGLMSFDLDYPLRDPNAQISPEDRKSGTIFHRFVYELLLKGEFDEVRKECENAENMTLGMIICGLEDYINPTVDVELDEKVQVQEGINKKALWRRAVYALAQNPGLDIYERAIYFFLAGVNCSELRLTDTTWESDFLTYLNEIWEINIENFLIEEGRIDSKDLIIPMPSDPITLQNALDLISSKHPLAGQHPIRVLIGSVILNNLPSVISSSTEMLVNIVQGEESSNDLFQEPYLLRVVVHLVIVTDVLFPGLVDADDKSRLLTAYVSILSFHRLYDAVPVYISFLNSSDVLDAYSYFLSNLIDPAVRQRQLDLSKSLHLPTANILKRTAQRIFDDTEKDYIPTASIKIEDELTDADRKLIMASAWLFLGDLQSDGIDSLIATSRRFLINGKVKAIEVMYQEVDLSKIINRAGIDTLINDKGAENNRVVQELQNYEALTRALQEYQGWKSLLSDQKERANVTTHVRTLKNLSATFYKLARHFLVELTESDIVPDKDVLYEIRALYTPYLLLELHGALVTASKILNIQSFITEALSLTKFVANETDRIYLLFQSSGRLEEYLQLVARTASMVKNTR
ncbi:LAMI_0E03004g1_1 [Lachancea mirantina]|uniref:Nuclear pore complex protein n=1 Tax=Lachancea mirantina TaxID=1230905 RepID=A0A1G4JJJ8_9SACH|nr:LAMI_0E03004g1_1 [Lachancea mirantina]